MSVPIRPPRCAWAARSCPTGSGRRLFTRNGPNVRGNYDGARLVLRAQDWRIDTLAFRPVRVDAGPFDDGSLDAQTYGGVYATGPIAALAPLRLDLYALHTHREGARFNQGSATERRHSLGARAFGRDGSWDHDHEATLQWGRFGAASIAAWALASETGYTWPDARGKRRASLRVTVGSGDRDAADASLQTFNSLFPRGGAVDDSFNVSAANMTQVRLAMTVRPLPATEVTLALNTQWRTHLGDGMYGPGGGLLRGAGQSRARHVCDGIDLFAAWNPHRNVAFELQAAHVRGRRFIADSGPNRSITSVQPTLHLRF